MSGLDQWLWPQDALSIWRAADPYGEKTRALLAYHKARCRVDERVAYRALRALGMPPAFGETD